MKRKTADAPLTTSQRLGSLVKSARDIMRKDKGLNGDLDRLPMLTWVLFLKFLDDHERIREGKAKLGGERFRPAIEKPYRWRDWAAREDGITGDELIAFINQEKATRPDGKAGLGLFAYLRQLRGENGADRRDVIASVFRGTVNRMVNGYLLRDVLNKVNAIHFDSSDEIHTLGHLYESMLREMRDAAGDSGEFYTPRPVVKFIVEVTNPRVGETVLDPACGTGGFLVEAFLHLEKQCRTVQQRRTLQERSLMGGEAKSLPFLLAQMNLVLHGLESPRIDPGNSLAVKVTEIGDRERVDVIMTNPPFGGEEERSILSNFPSDRATAETALLFLQLIMRKLKRPGHGSDTGGRAAVVVPNGTLFGDGVSARIKEDLLKNYNLHTVVRLPNGVFAPYTSIPTNILFFDRSGPTDDIWFYEQPLPEGRKGYTKTKPIQVEDFAPCIAWWGKREENERAWKVKAADVLEYGVDGQLLSVNLDIKNRTAVEGPGHSSPEEQLLLLSDHQESAYRLSEEIVQFASSAAVYSSATHATFARLRDFSDRAEALIGSLKARQFGADLMIRAAVPALISDAAAKWGRQPLRTIVDVRGGGTPDKGNPSHWLGPIPWISPKDMKRKVLDDAIDHISVEATESSPAKLLPAGAVLVVVRGMILAHTVPVALLVAPAAINQDIKALLPRPGLDPAFLCSVLWAMNAELLELIERSTHDTRKLQTDRLLDFSIPVPPVVQQRHLVAHLNALEAKADALRVLQAQTAAELDALPPSILDKAFRGEL